MEKEFNLYQHIIAAVDKQIETGEPVVTGETYERLMDKGYDSAAAKEMIASVIAEELYSMMTRDDKVLDEESFAEKLSMLE